MKYIKITVLMIAWLTSAIGYAQSNSYEITAQGTLGKYNIKMDLSFDNEKIDSGAYRYDWGSRFTLRGAMKEGILLLDGSDGGKFRLRSVGDSLLMGSFVYKGKTFPVKLHYDKIENEDFAPIQMPLITEITGHGILGKYKIKMRLRCVDEVFDEGAYSYESGGGTFTLQGTYQDGIYRLTGSDGGVFYLYYDKENYLVGTFTHKGKVYQVRLSWTGNRGGGSPDMK